MVYEMSKMKIVVWFVCLLFPNVFGVEIERRSASREGRKLFGGYRITPRFCQPTRELSEELHGPNICMFNHECIQRNGIVVGACMDGFLFGACCQLPAGSAGELMEPDDKPVQLPENGLHYTKAPGGFQGDITSSGVSQITNTLLHHGIIPTAQDDAIVQVSEQDPFASGGVTHPTAPDTFVVNHGNNDINPDEFQPIEDRKTTVNLEDTTKPYIPEVSPYIQISISNAPPFYTAAPGFQKPQFRPKPQRPSDADKYVLVQTFKKPNKTSEIDSIVNIIQMLNSTSGSTTRQPPSTSYVFSATTTRRPGYDPNFDASKTTKAPPSSYVTTAPPRRTTTRTKQTTSRRKITTKGTKKPTTSQKRPAYQYVSSSTFRPTSKPPSTSYIYSSTVSKRPTTSNAVPGLGYQVTKAPQNPNAPTLIVLGPIPPNSQSPTRQTTPKPSTYSSAPTTIIPSKHPVAVTINNHITQNIYSTSERPSPTVLITPKPSASTSPRPTTDFYSADTADIPTSANDINNFPPVRNPNLNMSAPIFDENDITTPNFIEDDVLNTKVESFVNKIIQGLQEPFQGLKDVVYNKNKTTLPEGTTKKPVKKGTTKRPSNQTSKAPTRKSTTLKTRPATGAAAAVTTTKKPATTRRPKPTKRTTTTTQSFIETDESGTTENISQDYRSQCGARPLMKSGRIVGGKGANFGEFPWQVLVRESTWLGLFTKNKCGGVLISNRFVMTAAHCQPGFLASLVAVFGEFDISGDLEAKRALSRNVKRVIVHRQYDAATFENDLALLEMEHPIQFDAHIVPICLPRDHEDFTGRMATVTGWGRLKYGGGVPSVLQEVQVPIMENVVCQEMFRTAGHSKVILESFLCAGYANGQKDSCEGDSGGPLVLQRPDGRYQLAGTVSHGIKCAAPYLPGVYMRTTYYKPWIESITGIH